jgi:hypothetical protein
MTRRAPGPDCVEVAFSRPCELAPSAEVALEDYARVVAGAVSAEALADEESPRRLRGVHLCHPATPPGDAARCDIEAFAHDLAAPASERLGWS